MVRAYFFALLLCIFAIGPSLQAQTVDLGSQEQLTAGPKTEGAKAYARVIRYRVINDGIMYLNPDEALKLRIKPQQDDPPIQSPLPWGELNIASLLTVVAFAIVIGLIIFLVRRPLAFELFHKRAKNTQISGASDVSQPHPPKPSLPNKELSEILSTTDRRAALAMLTWKILDATLTHYGMLRQSSWTAREALHHLSEHQQITSKLYGMIRDCEAVQFGNYPISESEFRTHVDTAQSLLQKVRL